MYLKLYEKTLHKISLTCSVCKADKLPLNEILVKCSICGQEFKTDTTYENNHFVCHTCRQKIVRDEIISHCLLSEQSDPYHLMLELMKLPGVAMHGAEHHLLLTASLLTAFCKIKGQNDLVELLKEANNRSMQVPGGACGNWGTKNSKQTSIYPE